MAVAYTEAAYRTLLDKAIHYASEAHAGQLYGKDKPYTWHLRAVAENAMKWVAFLPHGCKPGVAVIAAWLHDTKEDCGKLHDELVFLFGDDVADDVEAVTNEEGANRQERNAKTWVKTRKRGPSAVYLKLMDRISNVEAGGKSGMYRKEFHAMKAALYIEGEMDAIWKHLEHLLFPDA